MFVAFHEWQDHRYQLDNAVEAAEAGALHKSIGHHIQGCLGPSEKRFIL